MIRNSFTPGFVIDTWTVPTSATRSPPWIREREKRLRPGGSIRRGPPPTATSAVYERVLPAPARVGSHMIPAPVRSVPQTDRWCLQLLTVCNGGVTRTTPLSRSARSPPAPTAVGHADRGTGSAGCVSRPAIRPIGPVPRGEIVVDTQHQTPFPWPTRGQYLLLLLRGDTIPPIERGAPSGAPSKPISYGEPMLCTLPVQ